MDCPLVTIAPGVLTCPQCGRLLRSRSAPERIHRGCADPTGTKGVPTVSTIGKWLLQFRPGDRIKALAEFTRIEQLLGKCVKCAARRERYNRAWDRFAMKWCAQLPTAESHSLLSEEA